MRLADRYRLWILENPEGLAPECRMRITKHRIAVAESIEYLGEASILQIRRESARLIGLPDLSERCALDTLHDMLKAGLVERDRPNDARGKGPEKHGRPHIYRPVKE